VSSSIVSQCFDAARKIDAHASTVTFGLTVRHAFLLGEVAYFE